MPLIDEDKLAALYKEVDNERKSAEFFRQLHERNKKNLANKRFYVVGFYALLVVWMITGFYVYFHSTEDVSVKESLVEENVSALLENVQRENALLKTQGTDIQSVLRSQTVYTVQLLASSNERLALFSDQFVNFRAHPINDFYAYSLGNFATEEEAENFRQELIKMGFSDVWVTIYKENERILIDRE